MGFNDIFNQLSLLKLAVYAPVSYILPSRLKKYEELYDTEVASGGKGKLKQADREKSLQALMTVQPAQAAGKLGRIVPPDAAELQKTTEALARSPPSSKPARPAPRCWRPDRSSED
jgi:hypothetical protein